MKFDKLEVPGWLVVTLLSIVGLIIQGIWGESPLVKFALIGMALLALIGGAVAYLDKD